MNEIPVYKAEAELREDILTNRSIAYCQPASKISDDMKALAEHYASDKINDSRAVGFKMDKDLYYHQSILVSTTWNKNDDVFFPEHVWAARHTPEDKPTNLEHDQAFIVGHITGNWAIDEENQLIDDETAIDDLPEIFHILNSSVIYKVRDNKDDQKAVNDLIFQIEAGEKYVSMECLFSDFDYIVRKPDGDLKVIARTEETAFLTKYLRSYGGSGIYSLDDVELEIGRVMKNICFSGKGYVDKPANPDSIIFSQNEGLSLANVEKVTEFTEIKQSGVQYCDDEIIHSLEKDLTGEVNMSDILKEQNVELKASNDELKARLKELEEKVSKANIEKFESTISELETNTEDLAAKLKDSVEKVESVEKELDQAKESLAKVEDEKSELEASIKSMEAEKITSLRVATLTEAGCDKAEAETQVKLFTDLNDEQFKVVSDALVKSLKVEDTEVTEPETASEEEDDKEGESTADATDLDEVETEEEVDLSKASEPEGEEEISSLQTDLVKAFASVFDVEVDDSEIKDSLS